MNRFTLLLCACMIFGAASDAQVRQRARQGQQWRQEPATKPASPREALLSVLDVERQSQAFYRAVLNRHRPFHPFGYVYRIEQRHERTLIDELTRLEIAVPDDPWQAKPLVVPDERADALAKAAELEGKTIAAYDRALAQISDAGLLQIVARMRSDSADHQMWFKNPDTCPRGGGRQGRPALQ